MNLLYTNKSYQKKLNATKINFIFTHLFLISQKKLYLTFFLWIVTQKWNQKHTKLFKNKNK